MKVGNIEVPNGITLVFSFPSMTSEELDEVHKLVATHESTTWIATNMKLKVIAKNSHVIVLEGTRV
jgi:hypothetical protein